MAEAYAFQQGGGPLAPHCATAFCVELREHHVFDRGAVRE
jgi:hypothetical protein